MLELTQPGQDRRTGARLLGRQQQVHPRLVDQRISLMTEQLARVLVGRPGLAQHVPVEGRTCGRAGHPSPQAAEVGPRLGLAIVQFQGPAERFFRRGELARPAENHAEFAPALGEVLLGFDDRPQFGDRCRVVGGPTERHSELVASLDVAGIAVDGLPEEGDGLSRTRGPARGGHQVVRLGSP